MTATAYMNTLVIADGEAYDWAIILQGDPCCYCGRRIEVKMAGAVQGLDHIIPLSEGGSGAWDNLTRACKMCNSAKRAKSVLGLYLLRIRQGRAFA